jgi:hypothetical protein
MGHVYERVSEISESIACGVRIKTIVMGLHLLEVARLIQKLGKLAHLADSYVSRAI